MMIVYAGTLGAGKTLGMTIKGLELHKQNPTMGFYANYTVPDASKLRSWEQLEKLENAIVLLDEGHILFDSRDFKFNVKKTHFALQSRHVGLIFLITTQVLDQIDLRIRRLVDYLVICQKKMDKDRQRYFEYQYMKASAMVTGQFLLGRKVTLKHPERYYNLYDTKEIVTQLQ